MPFSLKKKQIFLPLYRISNHDNATLMTKHIIILAFMAATFGLSNASNITTPALEIVEMDQTVQICLVNGSLHITGGQGQVLEIYNVAGVRVMTARIDSYDKVIDINLSKGCYIVKVGKTARKISIK